MGRPRATVRTCMRCRTRQPADEFATHTARVCNPCRAAERKPCRRCHGEYHPSDYVYGGAICSNCRADGIPSEWRSCFRCFEVKPPRAFPFGPSGRRRLKVCQDCGDRERAEREAARVDRTATWTDETTGQLVRRCAVCREVSDLETFPRKRKDAAVASPTQAFGFYCRECEAAERRRRYKEHRENEWWMAKERVKWAKRARARRRKRPELSRAAHKRYMDKVRKDPKRYAEFLETRRMEYRLRRMRQGKTTLRLAERVVTGERGQPRLAAAPLAAAIDRLIALEEMGNPFDVSDRSAGDTSDGRGAAICARLGIDPRNLYAWRTGERATVRFDVADKVVTRGGFAWWEVWAPDVAGKDGYETACRAFEGEAVAA